MIAVGDLKGSGVFRGQMGHSPFGQNIILNTVYATAYG